MKLEAGKFYRAREGTVKVEILARRGTGVTSNIGYVEGGIGVGTWSDSGRYYSELTDSPLDLIAEWSDKPTCPGIEFWVPICEQYKAATRASLWENRGSDVITNGKHGSTVAVLAWVKLRIDPTLPVGHRIIELE